MVDLSLCHIKEARVLPFWQIFGLDTCHTFIGEDLDELLQLVSFAAKSFGCTIPRNIGSGACQLLLVCVPYK